MHTILNVPEGYPSNRKPQVRSVEKYIPSDDSVEVDPSKNADAFDDKDYRL
jgi:hypothetical protein